MLKLSGTLVFICFFILGFAQNEGNDSTLKLQTVFIKSLRTDNLNKGTINQVITPTELISRQGSSMAEVLQENTPIFIRNYGSGGLATASFRGSNAYHTPVIWNGINIQNPMNGQIDFSNIPVFFSDEISLQYGGNGGIWGSGSMAGMLLINSQNSMKQKTKVELFMSAIDYGIFQNGIKVNLNYKKLFFSIKAYKNFGNNHFEYAYQNNRFYQKNAPIASSGIQQVFTYKKSEKSNIIGLVWYNESNNQIAPNINASNTNAIQKDKNLRTAITYQNSNKKGNTELKLVYLFDEILFESNAIPLSSNKSHTYNITGEKVVNLNTNNNIHFGLINWLAFAKVDGYEKEVNQNRLAGFFYLKSELKQFKIQQQIGIRKELVNADFIPFMPSYYLQYNAQKNLIFKFNTAATYRLPTFNDLYWKNGGNLNLQAEQGWGSDLSINYFKSYKSVFFDVSASFFYKSIENYIQWIPINYAIFSPINIGNVNTKGIEIFAKTSIKINQNSNLQINYIGSFLNAIDTKTQQQLIFTPRIKHVFNIIQTHKKFTLKYNHTYTGVSFTKADLSEWNDDFEIANLSFSKHIYFQNNNMLNLQFSANNIWDKSYQVMPDRPMPLRNFQLTIQYTFNK